MIIEYLSILIFVLLVVTAISQFKMNHATNKNILKVYQLYVKRANESDRHVDDKMKENLEYMRVELVKFEIRMQTLDATLREALKDGKVSKKGSVS